MPRKSKDSGYAPSGPRIDPMQRLAQQLHLPFTMSVVNALLTKNTSLQMVADKLEMHRDTLIRLLRTRTEDDSSVGRVLKIAEMLDLDPVQSLNEFFFEGEHIERALQFYISFNEHFLDAPIEERVHAFSIVDRFLSLPSQDQAIFETMLDAFQKRNEATPQEESGLPDTPNEE